MKKKTYKIIICISLVVMLLTGFGNVFGATNNYYTQYTQVSENALDTKIKDSILLDTLANMINAVASLIEYLIGSVFYSLTGDNIFPWADRIIFNGIAFLDINFLNPDENSLFGSSSSPTILGDVVRDVYSTIFSLAVLFLGVAVGIMAIRLAISSIAAEKAKYKQAIVNWVTCLVMLFLMHYILAFVFWINEQLVSVASGILIDTIQKNNLTTTNFKDALDAVVDSETRLKNFLEAAGTPSGNNDVNNSPDIASALITNEDYVESRLKYVNDSGKPWYQSLADFFGNVGGMMGDIGLPRLTYDVKDAKAIGDLSDQEKNDAKKNGYYNVNGHKIFITEKAYHESDEYRQDVAATIFLSKNASDPNAIYYFYKDHPEIKIKDADSPNLWQANAIGIVWSWWGGTVGNYDDILANLRSKSLDEVDDTINQWMQYNVTYKKYYNKMQYRLTADKYIINAANGFSSIENGEVTDIIANLGSFFKQAAYVYTSKTKTTNSAGEEEVITGWRASKVSVTGALLYAIFIFQSCMYLIMYVKRLFYVMMLSMFGPIVVIYDFFTKSAS